MKAERTKEFIKVEAEEGLYLTDSEKNFITPLGYFPLDYDTSRLTEITEDDKIEFEEIKK